jgi:oligosaccharide repeat unit polymerase
VSLNEEDAMNLLVLLPIFALGLLALVARACGRSWLDVGPFFALVWFVQLTLPLIFAPDYLVMPRGLWWIVGFAMAVCVGNWMVQASSFPALSTSGPRPIVLPHLRKLLIVAALCGILSSVVAVVASGRGLGDFLSSEAYVQTAHEFSVDRYAGGYVPPFISQILLVGTYLAPIFGGILFAIRKDRRDLALVLFSTVPALLIFFIHTTRAVVVFGTILTVGAYFSAQVFQQERKRIAWRTWLLGIGVGATLVVLFSAGQVARAGEEITQSALLEQMLSAKSRSTFFGHIAVFSQWFEAEWNLSRSPAWGGFSLSGPFEMLGLVRRELGVYADSVVVESGGTTNIYTLFRGFVEDWTPAGALIFGLFFGAISGHAHRRITAGGTTWIPIVMAFYFFTCSFMVSPFTYNTLFLAWLVVAFYFLSIRYWPVHPRAITP